MLTLLFPPPTLTLLPEFLTDLLPPVFLVFLLVDLPLLWGRTLLPVAREFVVLDRLLVLDRLPVLDDGRFVVVVGLL